MERPTAGRSVCRSGSFHLKNKHISLQNPPIVKGRNLVK